MYSIVHVVLNITYNSDDNDMYSIVHVVQDSCSVHCN